MRKEPEVRRNMANMCIHGEVHFRSQKKINIARILTQSPQRSVARQNLRFVERRF
jgi:hypothetical protein